jgi:hypothetical protein
MNEKNLFSGNLTSNVNEAGNAERKISPEKKLVVLLMENKLSRAVIIEEAEKAKMSLYDLVYGILSRAKMREDFIYYASQEKRDTLRTESEMTECMLEFFEKIQQPEKIEEVVMPVDIPEVPAEPEISPVETPEPAEETQLIPEPVIIKPVILEPELQVVVPSVETFPKPEMKNWWEVKRETEVMAIEDLDGDMRKFEQHVKELCVAKKDASGHWQWTGGNKKLVFLGDILGDRKMDGMKITLIIGDLAEQAEKQGGQIDFICGNHDIEFIQFLCSANRPENVEKNADLYTHQGIGIWELANYDPSPNSELKKINPFVKAGPNTGEVTSKFKQEEGNLWAGLYKKVPEILANMKTNPDGIKFLKYLSRLKIAVVYDDTLFCHTDPTHTMVADLSREGNMTQRANEINLAFQEDLEKALFNGDKLSDEFWRIEKVYLRANNRDYFVEKKAFEKLAGSLLVELMEGLYIDKKIRFIPEREKALDENGFKNRGWLGDITGWETWYLRDLASIDLDDETLKRIIGRWMEKNGLNGLPEEYAKGVIGVLGSVQIDGGASEKSDKMLDEFYELADKIERVNPAEIVVDKVRSSGVNTIIHGHSPLNKRFYENFNLVIVSPHANFGSGGGVMVVKKSGKIDLISTSFRDKKPR